MDAVIIATPDHWHAPMAQAAIEAGIHTYIEKPMAHTIGETYLLREAVRKNLKAILAMGYQQRLTCPGMSLHKRKLV